MGSCHGSRLRPMIVIAFMQFEERANLIRSWPHSNSLKPQKVKTLSFLDNRALPPLLLHMPRLSIEHLVPNKFHETQYQKVLCTWTR